MTVRTKVDGFDAIELQRGGARIVIVPALGGKIAEMELAGRQWLWKSDVIPYRTPAYGTSYVRTADTGGYDECFPTVGECTLPDTAMDYVGLTLPDHGELWSQRPATQVDTARDEPYATTVWHGRRMPYRFERTVRITPAGEIVAEYRVSNQGRVRMPFIWSSHPLLPLTAETRIELPDSAMIRVYAQHGIDLGGPLVEHRWPNLTYAGGKGDFSHPYAVAPAYACKLFLHVPAGRASLIEGDARLDVSFDAQEVPDFGVWINRNGWTPFPNGAPYCNLAFEPCIGAPDTLSDALGAWHAAHWLGPGEARRWSLTWRGERSSHT